MTETAEKTYEAGLPASGTWEIDPVHTSVGFTARHMMVTKVRGLFRSFTGTVHLADRPEHSWAEIEIDAASVDTRSDMRDNHLRSADFLDVERFPKLRFRSTRLEQLGEERFNLHGELTIRDVTRPVTLDVTFDGVHPDAWGGTRMGFSAGTELNREDFGLTWNQLIEGGGVAISKKIRIEIEVEAVHKAGEGDLAGEAA